MHKSHATLDLMIHNVLVSIPQDVNPILYNKILLLNDWLAESIVIKNFMSAKQTVVLFQYEEERVKLTMQQAAKMHAFNIVINHYPGVKQIFSEDEMRLIEQNLRFYVHVVLPVAFL